MTTIELLQSATNVNKAHKYKILTIDQLIDQLEWMNSNFLRFHVTYISYYSQLMICRHQVQHFTCFVDLILSLVDVVHAL
ncbi:hypothetical protein JHK86_055836 [Glycine max]|nr:hypothetical protein JHK86_055836 [Glycine max]